MALIHCPECSKEFTNKVTTCPNCAYTLTLEDRIALHCDIDWQAVLEQGKRLKNLEKARDIYGLIEKHCPDNAIKYDAINVMGCSFSQQGNKTQAFRCYTQAAENGNADACHNLGVVYSNGNGVEASTAQALFWYERGIELGRTGTLTLQYAGKAAADTGHYDKAFRYYTAACQLGNGVAHNNLGVLYHDAKGVKRDLQVAIHHFKSAIAAGGNDAELLELAQANLDRAEKALVQERKMQLAPANDRTIPIIQEAESNHSGANVLAIAGIVAGAALFITGLVICMNSFLMGLFIGVVGFGLGAYSLSASGDLKAEKRRESVSSYVTSKSGTAFQATCSEVLPGVGDFSVDILHKKWTYGTSGRVHPVSMITNVSIEYGYKHKNDMTKRVVAGTVLGGAAGALIGAATSTSRDEKTGHCRLTIETNEPGFGKRSFEIYNNAAEAIAQAIERAKQ